MEKEAELKRKIKSAMLYPIIILCSSLVIATFLTTFALPRIANVFLQGGVEPPTFSRIVFSVGLFVGNNVWTILISLSVLVGSSLFFILKTRAGKDMVAKAAIRLPLVRNLLNELAIQRFSSTFGILLSAGIPIIEALRITSDVVGIPKFRDALIRIADEGLAKGLTIGDAFKREGVFPKTVVNLVAISEKAGHLEEVLETLADFYASNVDAGIKTAVSFLEPALLLFMGLIVGTIALSIIVPIYQLTSQF